VQRGIEDGGGGTWRGALSGAYLVLAIAWATLPFPSRLNAIPLLAWSWMACPGRR
jgi:hypothetical protein